MKEGTFLDKFLMSTLTKKNVIEAQNTITKYIEKLEERNRTLREKLENYNKEEEILKLQNENDDIRGKSLVILTDLEQKRFDEFRCKHYESCKGKTKVILNGTGLGWGITLKCDKCNDELDITDYDMW